MRWKGRRQSENVEDRRSVGAGTIVAGGGVGTLILAVVVMLLGGDPGAIFQGGFAPSSGVSRPLTPEEEERREFVSVVLADTEDVWREVFRTQLRREYDAPKLVLFSGQVQSACGFASSAVGPFYCPGDGQVFIDLEFFTQLERQLGAPGDFAQAYVVAHEVGHHVQNLLGISDRVQEARGRVSQREFNSLSVRLELQADYFAGLWAHHAKDMAGLDRQDIEEAMRAAAAIGDDRLQKRSQGFVVPESFTHGSSEQRVRWFMRGFESGRVRDGDTFNAPRL